MSLKDKFLSITLFNHSSSLFQVLLLVSEPDLWVELLIKKRKENSWNVGRRIWCEQASHVQGSQIWLLEGNDDCLLRIHSHWYVGCCRKGQSHSSRRYEEGDPQGQMGRWSKIHIPSQGRNALLCSISKEEYSKVHNFRSSKHMRDTLCAISEEEYSKVHNFKSSKHM